jgi:hypothetical protein
VEPENGDRSAQGRPWTVLLLSVVAAAVILAGVFLLYRVIVAPPAPIPDALVEVTEGTAEAWPSAPPTFTATPRSSPSATLPPPATATPTPTPTPLPPPVWEELGHLTSIRFTTTTVVERERERQGLSRLIGTDRVLLMAVGQVHAGVDLSEIRPEDVEIDGTKVRVAVPHATVSSVELLPGETRIYDSERSWILSDYEGLETEALEQARRQLRQEAENSQGMMALADRVARLQLADLLYKLGFTEVDIVFRD